MKYSLFNLLRQAASGHEHWPAQWRDPAPKAAYDVVIVGAGAHVVRKSRNHSLAYGGAYVPCGDRAFIRGVCLDYAHRSAAGIRMTIARATSLSKPSRQIPNSNLRENRS
jgi:hypothetical protein